MGQNESRHDGRRRPPSTMNGWLKKLRGHITFNERLVRRGNREIEAAHAYNDSRKERERRRRDRERSRPRGNRTTRGEYDKGSGSSSSKYSEEAPWMHYKRRCRPPYHGFEYRLMGLVTRRHEHTRRGLHMSEVADRERRRERNRRQRRLAEEGLALRMGASQLIRKAGSHMHLRRSHGSGRHHRSQRDRPHGHVREASTHPRELGRRDTERSTRSRHREDRVIPPRDDSRAPIAREVIYPGSPLSHTNYEHVGGPVYPGGYAGSAPRPMPVLRSIHSKNHAYYDDGGLPIVRSINGGSVPHSPYAPSAGMSVARSASSFHGRHYTH